MSVRVAHEHAGQVLRLTLNRPRANVIDIEMMAALSGALEAEVKAQTKAVLFAAEGRHFSFGASVPDHRKALAPKMLTRFHGLFRQLAKLSVPTCALVSGQCLGGGLELASWCTWIAATPDAKFGQPEVQLSVFPPMASILLPWRIGGSRAADLCVSGRSVDAEEAARIGLITTVAPDLEGWWAAHFDKHLASKSAVGLRFAERAARLALYDALDKRLPRLETLYTEELMATHDANEGIEAFIARRPPVFEDR